MRPPYCKICRKRFPPKEGGLVSFQLSENDKIKTEKFKQPGFVGHPPGREWFCGAHFDFAKAYSHLTLREAVLKIKDMLSEEE